MTLFSCFRDMVSAVQLDLRKACSDTVQKTAFESPLGSQGLTSLGLMEVG